MTPRVIGDIIIVGKEVMPMEIKHEDLIGTYEQKQAIAEQFNLMDDELFAVVMKDKAAGASRQACNRSASRDAVHYPKSSVALCYA